MSVALFASSLESAVNDAYLTLDKASSWKATADSRVVLVGDVYPSQIDVPKGITITAASGEICHLAGEYILDSGGILNVEA